MKRLKQHELCDRPTKYFNSLVAFFFHKWLEIKGNAFSCTDSCVSALQTQFTIQHTHSVQPVASCRQEDHCKSELMLLKFIRLYKHILMGCYSYNLGFCVPAFFCLENKF